MAEAVIQRKLNSVSDLCQTRTAKKPKGLTTNRRKSFL